MKKTLSLLLVLAMVLGSFSFAFADEAKVDPAVEAGEFLKKAGVLEGNDSGDLMLDKQLKRQDAVVLLSRLMKAEEEAAKFPVTEEYPTFKDITNNYYKPYLAWAQANKYYEGHNAEKFGYGEFLTAQQYATVLLRALGYEVNDAEAYKAAFETAKKLGIMKDLKVEEKAEITRGQMAQMTFNALSVKMKDSDKTLAEFLKIEMPEAPKADKLEAKVYTDNLKEVVVELNDASLVDAEKLTDVRNYRLAGETLRIAKAELKDNKVILLIADEMDEKDNIVQRELVEGREYDLLIRNIDKAINKTHGFTAKDNTIPAVEKVVSLGEYGIKVTTTEPVKNPQERNFLIDGKNVAMKVEQYGRVIILTPYHKQAFPEDAKTLTVKELVDFAGYKSASENIEFEMIKDEEGPKVVSAVSTGKDVLVTFDKDVYNDSVSKYWGIKVPGNIYYMEGRYPVYSVAAEKIDTNKVLYTFKNELPRRAQVTIEGVENHSKVAMEKVTVDVVEIVDRTEPEIIAKTLWDRKPLGKDKSQATIRLYFDKDIEGYMNTAKTGFEAKDHFVVYQREVLARNKVNEADITATYLGNRKDAIEVVIKNLSQNNLDGDYDYILEIFDFWDAKSERNKMYRDYMDFEIREKAAPFNVLDVEVTPKGAKSEIAIYFDKPVDRTIAEDPTNYIFGYTAYPTRKDVKDLGGNVIVEKDGKIVTLVIPEFEDWEFDNLRILDVLKDKDGIRLSKTYTFEFDKIFEGLAARARKAEADAVRLELTGSNEYSTLIAFDTTVLTGDARYTKVPYSKHYEFVTAVEKLEKAIAEADKTLGKDLDAAKKALRELLVEAKDVYAKLENKGTNEAKALAEEMAKAEALLAKEDATLAEIGKDDTTVTAPASARQTLKSVLDAAKGQLDIENEVGVSATNQVVQEGKNQTVAVPAAPATPVKVTVTIGGTATDGETVTLKLGDAVLAEAALETSDNTVEAIANKLATGVKSGYTVDKTDVATGKLVFTAEQSGLTNYQNSDVTIGSTESSSSVTASGTVVNGTEEVDEAIVPAKKAKVTFSVTVSYTDGKTKVGKIKVSLAGKDVEVEIPAGKTAAEVAELITTAVNADTGFEYTATVSGAAVTFEAKVAGATSLGTNPVTIAEVQ